MAEERELIRHATARGALLLRHAAAISLLTCAAAAGARAQTAVLHGTVTDSATGAPLAGARIEFAAGEGTGAANSDERGRYRIAVPAPAALTVTVTRIGYAPRHVALDMGGPGDRTLDVVLAALGLPLDPIVVTASRNDEAAFTAPASVSVVNRDRIEARAALTPVENVRTVPGMDLASKGLIQHTYAVRGERGSVSGALLTLTDFRYADVPSLSLNVPYLVSATNEDIDHIEVVRGPGAALYGPGADRGVLHFITRSPFESPGGTLTLTGGGRSLFEGTVRYAAILGRTLAFKISGDYLGGRDWMFTDSTEVAARAAALAGGASPDTLRIGRREPNLARAGGEARFDWRPAATTELVAAAGMADAIRNVELGGDVGSVQAREWRYTYVQARLQHRRLRANLFYNLSNTGDSYLLRSGVTVVDSSRVLVGQLQHGARLGPVDLLYGADARWTDPRTGGTIDGENEDHDRVTEVGGYLHGTATVSPKLDLVAALRADHHSRLDDIVLSPRIGLVFRPTPEHAFRLTYNRAFTSPDANTLSLDIVSDRIDIVPDSLQYLVRASSVPTAAQVGTNLAALNPITHGFDPIAPSTVADIPPLRRTITNVVELGWKAMIQQRYGAALDLYVSRVSDVLGSRYAATPSAFYDSTSLAAYLAQFMSATQAGQLANTIAQIPMGTVSPRQTTHPTDLLVLSRQGAAYTLWGLDVSLDLPISRAITVSGAYSWLSRDSITTTGVPGVFVLGVPRHKGAASLTWRDQRRGVRVAVEGRWVEGFPVNSGVYVGRVEHYAVLDAHLSLRLPAVRGATLALEAQNLLDNRHQEFVGAPALGQLLLTRLRVAF